MQSLVNRLAALAVLTALYLAHSAFALDPHRALTQSRLSVWTSESGLPQNTVDAIVQTRDGYLWIGTEEGLVRFDGVRFVVSDRQSAPALRSSFVSSLFEGPDGTLWIGTYGGGLARLRNGRIEAFHPELLGSDRIREMHAASDGALFAATAGGGLLRIEGEKVTRFTTGNGLPSDRIWALEDDGQGGMWVATHGGGVVRWRNSRVEERLSTREGLPSDLARTLLRDADGTLWIGTDGEGLVAWRGGAIARILTTGDGLPSNHVRSLQRDRDGSLWIGTDGGLARWRGGRADVLGVAEGLPSPTVRSLAEDREGSLWVGTTGGLVRMSDTRFLSFTRKEGLPVDGIRAILEDRGGRIWLGTEGGGLCRILPAPVQCLTTTDGLPHDTVYALAESSDGSLWVGTDGGGVVRFRNGKFVETIDAQGAGLPNNRVRAMVETADGGLWVSTTAGLALVRNGRASPVQALGDRQLRPLLGLPDGSLLVGTDGAGLWRVSAPGAQATQIATAGRGLESDRVFSLAADAAGGGVWIGTSGGGLARFDLASGKVLSLTRRDGLYDDVVFQVVDQGPGSDLWLTSNRGLYRVAREQVLAAMKKNAHDLSGTVYGTTDGMPSAECNAAFPAAIRARDGRLWIATARGVAVIDPLARGRNTMPPPVHVEEVLVDGSPATVNGILRVPPGAQRLELRYTALGLRAPERVTFRYLLEGYDRDWVKAGTSRVAHYTKLAPGHYTFRVMATNEDGARSNGEARLGVTVDPRWFETWWARLLAIALIAAAVWGAVQLRLAALRARKNEELARAYEDVRRIAAELEDTNRQLAVTNVRFRALSYVDGLTGVANRRRFDEALEEACAMAAEQSEPVSLVLIDLDHFKMLNDSQGHQDGDEALRAVATLLAERTETRGGLAARFGGEEFAWLLPGVALDGAKSEAEAFRKIVRDAAIRHDGLAGGIVTASLGVSSNVGMTAITPLSLVAAADAALYRAKSAGRDRVEAEGLTLT
jgi:diguanylate cyclase (GGDEF)-like protein